MKKPLEEAFLHAIVGNPEDDTPRLVYADWLEEQGRAERAEFIRVQCEKARLPGWDRRCELLAWRERVLLARNESLWRGELPVIPGVTWGAFERGFVEAVEVESAGLLSTRAADIRQAAPLRWATLTGLSGETWESYEPIPFLHGLRLPMSYDLNNSPGRVFTSRLFSNVKVLDLSGVGLQAAQLGALARSPQLAGLTSLILDDCSLGDGNLRFLVEAPAWGSLTRLSIKGTADDPGGYGDDPRLRAADIAVLAASPLLRRLQSLDLSGNALEASGLCLLLQSPHLGSLRELNVAHNQVGKRGINKLADIDTSLRLHRLVLSNNAIGEPGALALSLAPLCSELIDLDLEMCGISMQGAQHLAEAPWLPGLGRLNLNHNSAGTDGVCALARGLQAGQLFALHLRDNEFGTEAVKLLASSPGLAGLLTLDLSENALDAAALKALASSPHLGQLRRLHLEHCLLNPDHLRALRAAPWLARLVQLKLSENAIGDKGLSALLEGSPLAQLNELALRSCDVGVEGVKVLAGAGLKELHWLDLSRNRLDPSAVTALARSPLAGTLVELDLEGNAFGDEGARALAAGTWPLLKRLCLRSVKLSEKGLQAIAESPGLAGVTAIHCGRNTIHWWRAKLDLGPRFITS